MSPADPLGFAATNVATDAAAAVPEDVYSTLLLEALYAERAFEGIVAATTEDLTAAAGDTVKVTYISPRVAQGPIDEGTALDDEATTIAAYPIELAKYGDYDLVNREVFEDQTLWRQEDFIRNMGRALGERVDQEVYDVMEGATPGSFQNLGTAGTLTDLYDKIVDLKAAMRKAKYRPSHILIGPDQEAQFLKDTDEGIKLQNIQVSNGQVLAVAGLPVIVSPLANANDAVAGTVQAILIDRSRAVGEVWGRRPDTTVDATSRIEFDQVKLVTWLRFGVAALDTGAIGHIRNAP